MKQIVCEKGELVSFSQDTSHKLSNSEADRKQTALVRGHFFISILFCIRLVDGLKFMGISSLLPPLEGLPMKLLSRSQRDHLCCSSHFYKACLYRKRSNAFLFA